MSSFPYLSFGLNLLLPGRCLVCDGQLSYHQPHQVCAHCWERLPLIQLCCPVCGRAYASFDSGLCSPQHQCGKCRQGDKLYFTRARSIGFYRGSLKKLIHLLKYQKKDSLGRQLANWMIQHTPEDLDPAGFDYIMPVPLHIKRLREREFNQSLLLAKHIARHYQRPLMAHNLYRRHFHQAQAQLKRNMRTTNIKHAFGVRYPHKLTPKRVLLIDDVYTTGATVRECAKVLLKSGADRVEVLTLARTEERD